jgi:hypothetical protein
MLWKVDAVLRNDGPGLFSEFASEVIFPLVSCGILLMLMLAVCIY